MQVGKVSEKELIRLLCDQQTKEKGFRVLVLQYQERLYWHIRKIVKIHEDTDDVLQNVFIKIYRNISKFKGDSKLYTWLYRIATNESLTFIKKKQRNTTETIDNPDFKLSERLVADSIMESETIQDILQKAVATLPEKQKLIFNMRYFDEMSYQNISKILGTSEGGLKASYHHAAKKIEAFIKNKSAMY